MADAPLMKIRAIAPWFGGKRTLAPRIVEALGPHVRYFEPYCGSAAVYFHKTPSRFETLNDLHWDLTNLALVLQEESLAHSLYRRAMRSIFAEGLLAEAQERLQADPPSAPDLCRAYWYFIGCWMARNGVAGTTETNYRIAVRWTGGGGSPTTRWRSVVDSIPAWHQRLRNAVILNRKAEDIIPRFEDTADTAIYADPPYPHETRNVRSAGNSAHTGRYLHDFSPADGGLFGVDDHALLAEQLNAFKHTRIVVSSYDCPRIRKLYEGWRIDECPVNKQIANQNKRGNLRGVRCNGVAPEILLVNNG